MNIKKHSLCDNIIRYMLCLTAVMSLMATVSCNSKVAGLVTEPRVFHLAKVTTVVKGELILTGTFGDTHLDKEKITIDQKITGQLRYIHTSLGVSQCTAEFYSFMIERINMRMVMWFSKSTDSGYNTRFRLYELNGKSDKFLQLEEPTIVMIPVKGEKYLQEAVYFKAPEDYTFTQDGYTATDILIHQGSYLEFSEYEYGEIQRSDNR